MKAIQMSATGGPDVLRQVELPAPSTLSGIAVETDDRTGLAVRVSALRLGPHLEESWPRFWD